MTEELEQELRRRWPFWFRLDGDPQQTGMVDGFRHGDGWFDLVWQLCEEIEPLVHDLEAKTAILFEVLQVNEKLGTLRFYCNLHDAAIERCIERARPNPLVIARSADV